MAHISQVVSVTGGRIGTQILSLPSQCCLLSLENLPSLKVAQPGSCSQKVPFTPEQVPL